MKEMLEAAKFYKECIGEIRQSIMMEIQKDDNSLVNFYAKLFTHADSIDPMLHVAFTINGKEFNTAIPISRSPGVPAQDIMDKCIECVTKEISKHITGKVMDIDWKRDK